MRTPITIWQHGAGARVENPNQTLLFRHTGNALRIVGAAGSINWLHYPIDLRETLTPAGLQLRQVMLRYRCDSPTALITNIALYDAENRIFKAAGLNLCAYDWEDYLLAIERKLVCRHGLNLSIGVRFDGADNDTHALEISSVGIQFST
jgi:hypothetical protein